MTDPEFEKMIDGLMGEGFGVSDHFLDLETVEGLRSNLLAHHGGGEMKPAGIGKAQDFQRDTRVRGDVIRWIEPITEDLFERRLYDKIDRFISYLNRTCYTGLTDSEFHYAYYAPGSFYKRHLDQFRSDSGRKYSLVIYLNESWQPGDGGEISLYGSEETRLLPLAGRAVFFQSDKLEHEVHPAQDRFRLSIAGWLKRSSM